MTKTGVSRRWCWLWLLLWLLPATGALAASPAQPDQWQINFVNSCVAGMTAGAQGLPEDLSMSVCRCTAQRIAGNASSRLMARVAADNPKALSAFKPDIEACVQQELPTYERTHPALLSSRQPSKAVLCVAERFVMHHEALQYGNNTNVMRDHLARAAMYGTPAAYRAALNDALVAARQDPRWQTQPALGQQVNVPPPGFEPPGCGGSIQQELPPPPDGAVITDLGQKVQRDQSTTERNSAPYRADVIAAANKCRSEGGNAAECYANASPKRCEQLAIRYVSAVSKYVRAWSSCVMSCAHASWMSRTFGDCRREQ